jgi:hypothetical protein
MTSRNNRHLTTEATTRMIGDVAIYLMPSGEGWAVEAIDMTGEVVESESFATEEVARRFVAELVKDLS